MPWSSEHTKWFTDTGTRLQTACNREVAVWDFNHADDEEVLKSWARHFRNHYCLDTEIDDLIDGTTHSRADYLSKIRFPDKSKKPGPSIRAGDFGEVLTADYLEYILNFWVPRTRYGDKAIRNESTKGCDIIGFRLLDIKNPSPQDILAIFECKAQFSGKKPKSRLQDAIDDSAKDILRKAESLNAIKQRLLARNDRLGMSKVARFQSEIDRPYQQNYGAAALFDTTHFGTELEKIVRATTAAKHPSVGSMTLLIIKGNDMMQLAHQLYQRAADEA